MALRSAAFGVLLRAMRTLSLRARACARPHRDAFARRRGRAGAQLCVAACHALCEHAARLGHAWQVWLVRPCARVCDGRPVTGRVYPRARAPGCAAGPPRGWLWCMFVHWLVLCAIGSTQHFNLHTGVPVVARVLAVRAATAVRARESGHRVAWRPGQRAGAVRVGCVDTPLFFGDFFFSCALVEAVAER